MRWTLSTACGPVKALVHRGPSSWEWQHRALGSLESCAPVAPGAGAHRDATKRERRAWGFHFSVHRTTGGGVTARETSSLSVHSARPLRSMGAHRDFTMREKGPRGCSMATGMGGAAVREVEQRQTSLATT
jgi:hypothetical protein